MNLQQILKNDCFKPAKVVSHHKYLDREVSSVMILEATDIEKWGRKHQLILTSYYALIDLHDDDLLSFFKKLVSLEISGLVLKVDRLVKEAPTQLIEFCNTFDIPLIEIPETVKYETIILAVLQPIINENSQILNSYYNARKTINQLSFKEFSIDELLNSIRQLIKSDIQFENESKSFFYSTFVKELPYKVIHEITLPKIKFVDNQYFERVIEYSDGTTQTIVSVNIPDLLDNKYVFSVFISFDQLNENDIMMIENATELLLTELLKIYAIKKNQSMRKNNQMHDLLLARYYSEEERNSILSILEIDKFAYYQGIMVSIYGENRNNANPIRSPLDPAINYIRLKYKHVAYFQKNFDIVFLVNLENPEARIKKEDLVELLEICYSNNPSIYCHIGLSACKESALDSINDNLLNLKKFMHIVHQKSTILDYEQLGFFKLFYKIENIDELFDYVPKHLFDLVKENVDYAHTFLCFLANNHNYVKTAEQLFIHPKTVRYRIDKVVERLGVSLNDSDTLLSLQVALKICEYAGFMPTNASQTKN